MLLNSVLQHLKVASPLFLWHQVLLQQRIQFSILRKLATILFLAQVSMVELITCSITHCLSLVSKLLLSKIQVILHHGAKQFVQIQKHSSAKQLQIQKMKS